MMQSEATLSLIWVYLAESPLFGLTLTMLAYSVAYRLYQISGMNPLANPVVTAVSLVLVVLLLSDVPYSQYFSGGQYVHFLLGPATVALAVPLYQQISRLRRLWFPMIISLAAGSIAGAVSAIYISAGLGASIETQLSFAPKSVTTPVAMGVSEQIGGLPSLTAVLVVTTGIIGAVAGTRLMHLVGVKDHAVMGVAMGVNAHGIGTARAFQVSSSMGAFSGLAMALSAFFVAFVIPVILPFII